jgi:DNA-binding NarL/FixJ family response regulator
LCTQERDETTSSESIAKKVKKAGMCIGEKTTTQSSLVRVVLLDDYTLARARLRELLQSYAGIQVVAEASTTDEALECIQTYNPDLVLIDSVLQEPLNLAMAAHITEAFPQLRVIILSAHAQKGAATQALRAGVAAYVAPDVGGHTLERVIHAVADSPSVAGVDGQAGDEPLRRLTARQRDVLRLIVEGLTTKEIAQRLQRSVKTIEAHRRQMMQRLGVHNVAELVRDAMQHNLHATDP